MKKLYFSMLFAVLYLASYAQSEHLTFKGIPIYGPRDECVAKMKQLGFTYIGASDNTDILSGDFAGFAGCTIAIVSQNTTDRVGGVVVLFPDRDNWMILENNYDFLKSVLTAKYGEPSDCIETFQGYSNPQTDHDKLYKLKMDKCTWYAKYTTPNGYIKLTIENRGATMSCGLSLVYLDGANINETQKQAINDL